MWYEQYLSYMCFYRSPLATEWTWVSRPINSSFLIVTVPIPGTGLQRPCTMGDIQERRATRASMASEQQAAGSSEGRGNGKELSFEDFVRNSFAAMGTKLDTLIAGQAALERKVNSLETKVNSNTTQITDIIKSVDFENSTSSTWSPAWQCVLYYIVHDVRLKFLRTIYQIV